MRRPFLIGIFHLFGVSFTVDWRWQLVVNIIVFFSYNTNLVSFSIAFRQSLKDGVAISAEERRPEDGGQSTDDVWCGSSPDDAGAWTTQQRRTVLRPLSHRTRSDHQSRRLVQVLPPEGLQSLSRVQRAANLVHRQRRLGLQRLLQDSVSTTLLCPNFLN